MTIGEAREELLLPVVRRRLLARILWGVAAGSAVELRPGAPVGIGEAREHVATHAGPEAARRVAALPALRAHKLRAVPVA